MLIEKLFLAMPGWLRATRDIQRASFCSLLLRTAVLASTFNRARIQCSVSTLYFLVTESWLNDFYSKSYYRPWSSTSLGTLFARFQQVIPGPPNSLMGLYSESKNIAQETVQSLEF